VCRSPNAAISKYPPSQHRPSLTKFPRKGNRPCACFSFSHSVPLHFFSLAGSSVLVVALCLMARFPLLLITVALTCLLFWRLVSSKNIRAFCDIDRQYGIKTWNRFGRSESSVNKQIRRFAPHSRCNPKNVEKCNVPLSSLDLPHVGSINPGGIRQGFLRKGLPKPSCAHCRTKLN
jgi:hypothetical protein